MNHRMSRRTLIEVIAWTALLTLLGVPAFVTKDALVVAAFRVVVTALIFRLTFLFRAWRWKSWAALLILVFMAAIYIVLREWLVLNALGMVAVVFALSELYDYAMLKFCTRIVDPNERLVISRMGGPYSIAGPGPVNVFRFYPFRDKVVAIDMREQQLEMNLPCVTQDGGALTVNLAVYWTVVQPAWTVANITDIKKALTGLATGEVAAMLGNTRLESAFKDRVLLNQALEKTIQPKVRAWGIAVTRVILKDLLPSPDVQARLDEKIATRLERESAENRAEGERILKVTEAKAKAEALEALSNVARTIDANTLNLKYLESLEKLGEGQSTKYVLPLELMNLLKALAGTSTGSPT